MTENKRFVIFQDNYDDLYIQDKEVYHATGIKVGNEEDVKYENVSKIVELLNELAEENEQLKQFQDSVFSWIDMHLQRLPKLRDDEFESDNEFSDPSLYSGAIQILETMKRELKGDVE